MSGAWTALVLAAGRPDDPLAQAEGVPNKTLIDIHGRSMLQRVLDALDAAPSVRRVVVAIEDAAFLEGLTPKPEAARAADRLTDTVGAALAQLGPPLLIVAGDHALLAPGMIEAFCAGVEEAGAGVGIAVARESRVRSAYPETARTYLRLADAAYAGCNLFALASADSDRAVAFWRNMDANRKKPWALLRAIDPWTFALYVAKRLTLDDALERLGRKLDLDVVAVRLEWAEAAIDVDKPDDLALARRIVAGRSLTGSAME